MFGIGEGVSHTVNDGDVITAPSHRCAIGKYATGSYPLIPGVLYLYSSAKADAETMLAISTTLAMKNFLMSLMQASI
jgi:hypothetical protein